MSAPAEMREFIDERAEGAVLWDDCDAAIVGIVERCGTEPLVCYDYDLLVQCFVAQGMTEEESVEWIDFNIAGAFIGKRTPMILHRPPT